MLMNALLNYSVICLMVSPKEKVKASSGVLIHFLDATFDLNRFFTGEYKVTQKCLESEEEEEQVTNESFSQARFCVIYL